MKIDDLIKWGLGDGDEPLCLLGFWEGSCGTVLERSMGVGRGSTNYLTRGRDSSSPPPPGFVLVFDGFVWVSARLFEFRRVSVLRGLSFSCPRMCVFRTPLTFGACIGFRWFWLWIQPVCVVPFRRVFDRLNELGFGVLIFIGD